MTERNDARYVEDAQVAFAIYCDTHGLHLVEGESLADELADALCGAAGDRTNYLPEAMRREPAGAGGA